MITNSPSLQTREIQRVTLWGLGLNLILAGLKFVVGFIGSSQALIADAVHSLSDSTTDLAVIVGVKYWTAPADVDHPYGHGRIETMITFFIGILLAGVGIGLAVNALSSIPTSHQSLPRWSVFGVACVSIVVKELMYQWTVRVGKRVKSSALIANAWHHRSDGLSSLPVAIAVLGIQLRPDWVFLDHIAAVIVSVFIVQAAWAISWPAIRQLVDVGATREEREKLRHLAATTQGVLSTHAVRTRQIGPGLQVDLHVMVDPEISVREGHNIAGAVKKRLLLEGPDVVDVLIHIEPYEPE